ncbi:MAG TPA: AAA family ATPase, partial [Thermodesulfobacteriota bacterium]|nr:AAA family ATPase [Thermodesulfobacteriota bacterium]
MKLAVPFFSSRRKRERTPHCSGPATPAYLAHYRFHESPFRDVPGVNFLWMGEKRKQALEQLRYHILFGESPVVITGDVGAGKTTFAKLLLNRVRYEAAAARVSCLGEFGFDLFRLISLEFGIKLAARVEAESWAGAFEGFLRESIAGGKKVALFLDEAQRAPQSQLEKLLDLTFPGGRNEAGFRLVLVGQNEVADMLSRESIRARMPTHHHFHLAPLEWEETRDYILFRLRSAQGQRPAAPAHVPATGSGPYVSRRQKNKEAGRDIFAPAALKEVFTCSGGIPRLINSICDSALWTSFYEVDKRVLPKTVSRCA